MFSGHGLLSSYEGQQGATNGPNSCYVFLGAHTYTRASPAQGHHRRHGPRHFNLTYSVRRVALRTLAFWLLLFLTFSVLVTKPEKCTLHGGQSRSWSAEQRNENRESLAAHLYSPRCSSGENQIKSPNVSLFLDGTQVLVSLTPVQESFGSSTWLMGVAPQHFTLPCAITTFPVSLPLSSPGDV